VGESIRFLEAIDGGLAEVMRRNRELTLEARAILCERLELRPVCPVEMLWSMFAGFLPDETETPAMDSPGPAGAIHPLQTELMERFGIETPIFHWPKSPHLVLRVAAQLYNSAAQYEYLAESLATILARRI